MSERIECFCIDLQAAEKLWKSMGFATGSGGYYVMDPRDGRTIASLRPEGELPYAPFAFSTAGAAAIYKVANEIGPLILASDDSLSRHCPYMSCSGTREHPCFPTPNPWNEQTSRGFVHSARTHALEQTCTHCGALDWTIKQYGRPTHKEACPDRKDKWHQGDPLA
jgi:hypothetical protein